MNSEPVLANCYVGEEIRSSESGAYTNINYPYFSETALQQVSDYLDDYFVFSCYKMKNNLNSWPSQTLTVILRV